jgi:hypothetical protein
MKTALAVVLLCLCAAPASAALLFYDGFDYTVGQKLAPRNDTTGTPNPGQFNVEYGVNWRYAGGGAASNEAPGITSGSLTYPGLAPSTGNSVAHDMTQLGSARIQVTPAAVSTGTIYWSGLLRVNDIGTLTTGANGMLLGGFNNLVGPGTLPGTVFAVLRIRKDTSLNQYYVGTGMNAGTVTGNIQFDTTPRFAGDTVFVVASYEFVPGSNNDIARMWVNPDPSTFRTASPPPPTLISQPGGTAADAAQIFSYNLRNVNTVGNPNVQFDELRVGDDWASVTIPEPATLALFGLLLVGLMGLLRRR